MIAVRFWRRKDPGDSEGWSEKIGKNLNSYSVGKYSNEELGERNTQRSLAKAGDIGDRLWEMIEHMAREGERANLAFDAGQYAGTKILPVARAMFKARFASSGVGTKTPETKYKHSGNMRRGVDGIGVKFSSRSCSVIFSMPPNMPDYPGANGSQGGTTPPRPFYLVAGALQFGSSRMPMRKNQTYRDFPSGETRYSGNLKMLGTRLARALKLDVLANREIPIARLRKIAKSEAGQILGIEHQPRRALVRTSGGTIDIRRPIPFFGLTNSDKTMLRDLFAKHFTEYITAKITGQAVA